jgi:valyl-tRNA synthetase
LRLFAPHLPFVTEEVWSWWHDGSVHRSAWPRSEPIRDAAGAGIDPTVYGVAADVLAEIRKAKTVQQRSLKTEVTSATVRDSAERLALLDAVRADVCEAGRVADLQTEVAGDFSVAVSLAEPDAA